MSTQTNSESYTWRQKQILRSKKYFETRKRIFGDCASTIIENTVSNDPRPFIQISIAGRLFNALLDSGASVSILGKGSLEFLEEANLKYHRLRSYVRTADGTANEIVGYVDIEMSYNSRKKLVNFCICPSLQGEVYLGIDFWRSFNVVPMAIDVISDINPVPDNQHVLTSEQIKDVESVKSLFPSFEKNGLGRTSVLEHSIDVGESIPIKQRFYAISPAVQDKMYREIDRMIEMDVIEESQSSWSSPVVLVQKPNGKVRLCLDSRKINGVTKKDAYPLPLIDGLLGRLRECRYISSLDLKDAFWQIPLALESRDKTAFTVPGRPLYQFKVMPFGLCNAPQTMCRLMDKVIPHRLHDRIFVYLDDLLIISSTYEEHLDLLRLVAKLLSDADLTINIQKSHFLLREIKYLGFLVGERGLRVDPSKVDAIVNFPAPSNAKQVRRFLGMAGWYRRFISNFSDIAAPLTKLTSKGKKFLWSSEAQESFERLKIQLTTAPVLINPDYTRPFFIRCDASTQGIGSVLFQKSNEGDELPICFMSSKLNDAQKNYSITELEMLAAVMSVKKFRPYIEGHDFTIITDHASLQWLMRNQRDLTGRLARWCLKLQHFNFKFEHVSGAQNVVPDTLSRIHCDSMNEFLENLPTSLCVINLDSDQFEDLEYVSFRNKIMENPEKFPTIRIHENKIYIRVEPKLSHSISETPLFKLWVPKSLVETLIKQEHDDPLASHGGINKTLLRLRQNYFWPGMVHNVRKFVLNCETCKTTKAPNQVLRPPLGTPYISERPFQRIYIDLLGPYPRSKHGKTSIIIVVDQLTKFVMLKTVNRATSPKIIDFLENEIFLVFGVPEIVVSDNGSQFVGRDFCALMKKYSVNHIRTAVYSPQANASERVNRSIIAAIRAYISNDHRDWDTLLPEIGSALRSSIHSSIEYSPHFALFGMTKIDDGKSYQMLRNLNCVSEGGLEVLSTHDKLKIVHEDIRKNLQKAFDKYSHHYNLRSRDVEFTPGQQVFVRVHSLSDKSKNFTAKFAPTFVKAFILSKHGKVNYLVSDENGKTLGTYHAKDIKL